MNDLVNRMCIFCVRSGKTKVESAPMVSDSRVIALMNKVRFNGPLEMQALNDIPPGAYRG